MVAAADCNTLTSVEKLLPASKQLRLQIIPKFKKETTLLMFYEDAQYDSSWLIDKFMAQKRESVLEKMAHYINIVHLVYLHT